MRMKSANAYFIFPNNQMRSGHRKEKKSLKGFWRISMCGGLTSWHERDE